MGDDELVVVCGTQNPLAAAGHADKEVLRQASWLMTRRGSIARDIFDDIAEDIQLPDEQRRGVVTHVPMLTLAMLTRTDSLAFLPKSVTIPWQNLGLVKVLDTPATTRLRPLGILLNEANKSRVVRKVARELMRVEQI